MFPNYRSISTFLFLTYIVYVSFVCRHNFPNMTDDTRKPKAVLPWVPFPLWLAAASFWLVPYKMHLLSLLKFEEAVPAFPELSTYMDDLPVMLSPSWWVVAHIATVSMFMLWAMITGLVAVLVNRWHQVVLWCFHLFHSALVLYQYDRLSTAVPAWVATLINVGGTIVLFWNVPRAWRESQSWLPRRYSSSPGNANVYWAVFGIPWWLELSLILRHIPLVSVPLVMYVGIWWFLNRYYFNRVHSHGHI